MGPIRGAKRKRVPEEDADLFAPAVRRGPGIPCGDSDWWGGFSRRLFAGTGGISKDRAFSSSSSFESVFKFSRRTFNYICSLVKDEMMSKHLNLTDLSGKHLSLNDRVAVALRRLSSGESLSVLGDSLGIARSAVGQITWLFVEAIEERGLHHLRWPSLEEDVKGIKDRFESVRGLPNCCGAIDVTHVGFCQSPADPAEKIWRDPEGNHSMILQAIVDPAMRFVDVFAGAPGSMSDAQTLAISRFFELAEEGKRLNGEKLKLSDGTEIREYLIGDSGFPHLPWLLTPYNRRGGDLSDHQSEFNRRHSATRRVAGRALTRLKDRWKIIQGTMGRTDKHKLPRIVLVCCLLHNILIDLEDDDGDEIQIDGALNSRNHDADYRQQNGDLAGINNRAARNQREKLALYLAGEQVSSSDLSD
ncbi:unnamed protein product [Cuscuta campestris]|uniref:DDE Tnp4 domain-containing protein n=1 Tax=Cuscuta campestris TaxID=132261 RepID=A0A484LY64_9ASTE|nr:unnamed protein product [Cuscuta campestris]